MLLFSNRKFKVTSPLPGSSTGRKIGWRLHKVYFGTTCSRSCSIATSKTLNPNSLFHGEEHYIRNLEECTPTYGIPRRRGHRKENSSLK
ncbi:hypothetical protein KC19_VG272500 [Ceratodon purpureus]|uniref:Uncharacterized protein n=1 Tax=Ceratodon purpureus TaxID=3225 RepID=A0A8T0HU60_CERPU|nr:hypothetical protein KC19_VG272500 [Ceratodon purpureus]